MCEFCDLGSCDAYLVRVRAAGMTPTTLGLDRLAQIVVGVAEAMEFLARKEVVHRDLATRNVLLCPGKGDALVAKVCDFGLSRSAYRGVYQMVTERPMPISWMAFEALYSGECTSAGDVWSFGVLLWEVYTLALVPFTVGRTVADPYELIELLESGYRMQQPPECPDEMYALMRRCWELKPEERPTFADMVRELKLAGALETIETNTHV